MKCVESAEIVPCLGSPPFVVLPKNIRETPGDAELRFPLLEVQNHLFQNVVNRHAYSLLWYDPNPLTV